MKNTLYTVSTHCSGLALCVNHAARAMADALGFPASALPKKQAEKIAQLDECATYGMQPSQFEHYHNPAERYFEEGPIPVYVARVSRRDKSTRCEWCATT